VLTTRLNPLQYFYVVHEVLMGTTEASGDGSTVQSRYTVGPGSKGPPGQPNRIALAKPTNLQSLPHGIPPSTTSDIAAHFPIGNHEWEALKHVIRDLYVVKNLPLRVVAQAMRMEHGFKARYAEHPLSPLLRDIVCSIFRNWCN
jgi:hypothetical protein